MFVPHHESVRVIEDNASTQRLFVICRECKHKRTLDYTACHCEQINQRGKYAFTVLYRYEGEKQIDQRFDRATWRCEVCDGPAKTRALKQVELREDRPCNAACEMATSEKCTCACGGSNHGIAHKH